MTDEELFVYRLAAEVIYADMKAWNNGGLDGAADFGPHEYWITNKNFLVESTRQFFKVGDEFLMKSDPHIDPEYDDGSDIVLIKRTHE